MKSLEQTIEELKINEKTCIHCQTPELAKQVLNIFNKLDLKWCDGEPYTLNSSCRYWDTFKENTVYYPFEGEFTSLSYARLMDYKIINAEEFTSLHKK